MTDQLLLAAATATAAGSAAAAISRGLIWHRRWPRKGRAWTGPAVCVLMTIPACLLVPQLGFGWAFLEYLVLGVLLVISVEIDLICRIIPNAVNIVLAGAAVGSALVRHQTVPLSLVAGAAAGWAALSLTNLCSYRLLGHRMFGQGDVKFAAACGAHLGGYSAGLFLVIAALLYAVIAATVRSRPSRSDFPAAVFLAPAAAIAWLLPRLWPPP